MAFKDLLLDFVDALGISIDDSGIAGTGGGGSAGGESLGAVDRPSIGGLRPRGLSFLQQIQEIEARSEREALRAQRALARSAQMFTRPSLFTLLSRSQSARPLVSTTSGRRIKLPTPDSVPTRVNLFGGGSG